jgi:hypothetical protein
MRYTILRFLDAVLIVALAVVFVLTLLFGFVSFGFLQGVLLALAVTLLLSIPFAIFLALMQIVEYTKHIRDNLNED